MINKANKQQQQHPKLKIADDLTFISHTVHDCHKSLQPCHTLLLSTFRQEVCAKPWQHTL